MTFLCLAGCATDIGSASETLVITGDCDVRGAGVHTAMDATFDGQVTGRGSEVTGRWMHTIPAEAIILGHPGEILCRINGRTISDFRGDAEVNGDAGYQYAVNVEDVSNSGMLDSYLVTEPRTLTASRFYDPDSWEDDGWTERTSFEVPCELPVTIGASGTGHAYLTFQRAETLDTVTCGYKGRFTNGRRYVLDGCTSDMPETTSPVEGGSLVETLSVNLHVEGGTNQGCGAEGAVQTTVELTMDVTFEVLTDPDLLRISVYDAAGTRVHYADGALTFGNLRVTTAQTPTP